jgi:hypothetical protein
MNFEEYLVSKKIDGTAFRAAEPNVWKEWNTLFEEMSPASFTAQKLYLINSIRRKYLLKVTEPSPVAKTGGPAAARPVMKPKPKIN